jgi:hypothetical protein
MKDQNLTFVLNDFREYIDEKIGDDAFIPYLTKHIRSQFGDRFAELLASQIINEAEFDIDGDLIVSNDDE